MKTITAQLKSRNCLILIFIAILAGTNSCKKQEFLNDFPKENQLHTNRKDAVSTIDSLQTIGFFIKNRRNPDAPLRDVAVGTNNNQVQLLNTGNEMEYTDESYMILGQQLVNPYSIPIMTQAYNAYFATNLTAVPVTHHYLRIQATSEAQIAILDDSLELDLFTHPLDHELIADGDLYVPPGGNIEDMPVLYSVVPVPYTLPAGIPYTLLSELHLPGSGPSELFLEEMAESIAAGAQYFGTTLNSNTTQVFRQDVTLSDGSNPSYLHDERICSPTELIGIIDDPCPDPGGGIHPPPPPPPPALVCGLPGLSCLESGKPRGRIRVWDTQLNQCVPVHDVQVRSKRWFKIRNTQTDMQGQFSINRSYNNNAKIQIIFRNGEISVKPLRNKVGIRLSLFPVKARIGMFSGCTLNTIDHIFYRTSGGQVNETFFGQDANDSWRFTKSFQTWLSATAIVARKNQLSQGSADGVGTMKSRSQGGHRLQVYLSDGGEMSARGCVVSMPMLAYMNKGFTWNDVLDIGKFAWYAFKTYKNVTSSQVLPAITTGITAAQTLGKLVFQGSLPDGILMYNTMNRNLSSSEVHEKFYEIYTNAGLLKNRANKNDWKNYLKRTDNRATVISSSGTLFSIIMKAPFPTNDRWYNIATNIWAYSQASASFTSSIAALATQADGQLFEMYNGFTEAYAHTLANRRYGTLADDLFDQNFIEIKGTVVEGAHSIYIENWKSLGVIDVESTVPKSGLFYDLWDTRQDLVNANSSQPDMPIIPWNFIGSTGLGSTGGNTSPQIFNDWRNNLQNVIPAQSSAIQQLFSYYQ